MATAEKKLMRKYRKLKEEELSELRATVRQSEQRTGDLEQHSHINDVIFTGLEMKHRSYTRAAAGVW